jgi:hypothetical protein
MLELVFKHEGTVNVRDLTSEDFDLPIQGEMKLLVWNTYNNDNEELVLPFGEFE